MTADLISRLEELEGPTLEADMAIEDAFPSLRPGQPMPRYTASLDAAVALLERVLPGWRWAVDSNGYADVRSYSSMKEAFGTAQTPAIALCIAVLKARGATSVVAAPDDPAGPAILG